MSNTQRTQLSRNSVQRRLQHPERVTTVRGVWQDNPTHPPARTATKQPASEQISTRPTQKKTNTPATHRKKSTKRKTVSITIWVNPVVKAELQRIAEQETISLSATASAFLEQAIKQDIHSQHGALLETIIDKAIAKHMRAYSNRLASLLVRSAFSSEQTRQIAANILSRQQIKPLMPSENLNTILDQSSKSAKRNIRHHTEL